MSVARQRIVAGVIAYAMAHGAGVGHAGTVWIRAGKTYQGSLSIEGSDIVVRSEPEQFIRLPLNAVAKVIFDDIEAVDSAKAATNQPPVSPGSQEPQSIVKTIMIPSDSSQTVSFDPWHVVTPITNAALWRANYAEGILQLSYAGGDPRDNFDLLGSVFRDVTGDFVFTARLTQLELKGNEAEPLAGLLIQRDENAGSPRAAFLMDSAGNIWRITRTRNGSQPDVSESKLALPLWLRVVRDGNSIRCYTANDGYHWELEDLLGMRLAEHAQIGFVAGTPDLDSPASATFDNIRLTLGPPPMESVAKGVLLVNGTFLAEPFIDLETLTLANSEVSVQLEHHNQTLTFGDNKLARILYRPLSADDADHLRGKTGVMLINRDFSEGTIYSVRNTEIVLESILLGRHMHRGGFDAACVVLRDPLPPSAPFMITTREGSQINAFSLEGKPGLIEIEAPILGKLRLPRPTVGLIQANVAIEH